jgi:hypothetical protein
MSTTIPEILLQSEKLPRVPRLSLAFPCLAVEVLRSRILDGSFFLGKLGGVHERLFNQLLLAHDTANGLVVGKLGKLEDESIEDGGLRFLIGLIMVSKVQV